MSAFFARLRASGAPLVTTAIGIGLPIGLVATNAVRKRHEVDQVDREAASILDKPAWPAHFAPDCSRIDESDDATFYAQPRIVQHIDVHAVRELTRFHERMLPKGARVLDLMGSWTSHLAEGAGADTDDGFLERVSALGLNAEELSANPALHDSTIADLNRRPALPYEDGAFDVVLCSLSVEYLKHPVEVLREVNRVLEPGGVAIFSFSNRYFVTKAVKAWHAGSEAKRVWLCGAFFHFAGGFEPPAVEVLSLEGRTGDPLYAVYAQKLPPHAVDTLR